MSWVWLEDGFGQHPKVIGLSDAAFRLHVAAICYCSKHSTDGLINTTAARFLVGARASKCAVELVGAGVWEYVENDTYRIHDFLDYNPSREETEARRAETHEAKARAGRAGGLAKASRRSSTTLAGATPSAVAKPSPVPSRPDPSNSAAAAAESDAHTRCYRAWQNQSPGGLNRYVLDGIDGLLEDGIAPELFEDACKRAGEAGGNKGWRYVSSIVQRLKSGVPEKQRLTSSDGQAFVSGLEIVKTDGRIIDMEAG